MQLRVESGKLTAQLISYSRSDTSGPKLSAYHIAPIQVISFRYAVLGGGLVEVG